MKRRQFLTAGSTFLAAPFIMRHAFANTPLKIVYFNDFAPFSFSDSSQVQGIYPDLLTEVLTNGLSIPVSHAAYPWSRAQQLVQAGEADAFFTTPTDARKAYAVFAGDPPYEQRQSLVYAKDHPRRDAIAAIKSVDELDAFTHGNYQGNGWAEANFKDKKIDWAPNLQLLLGKVAKQRNDVSIQIRTTAMYTAKKLGITDELAYTDISFLAGPNAYFGIRRNHPDADKIAAAFGPAYAALIAKGRVAEIEKRYIG